MSSRGRWVIGLGLVIVVLAAAVVILYVRGPKMVWGRYYGPVVTVVVPKEDIPANEPLDPLIDDGVFKEFEIPTRFLVRGAITDLEQLRGLTTTTPIIAKEQVSSYRLSSTEVKI